MKSAKRKLNEKLDQNLLDVGECSVHKVHNACAKKGLVGFCSDVGREVVKDM